MNFTDGISHMILERDLPIITFYDFYILGHTLFERKVWQEEPLKRMPHDWDQLRTKNAIQRMVDRRVLVADSDFRAGVWRVTQSTRAGSAEEISCIADPFCYVSHLSAMQRYGLTDRSPKSLHLTTPRRELWNRMRAEQIHRDLPGHDLRGIPLLNRPGFGHTLRRREIAIHTATHPSVPVPVAGEETRISSIGQTFADMLLAPRLCGGMRHVLDIWEREADQWLDEIVEAVDHLDSKIAKLRAGYILSEVLSVEHLTMSKWARFVQRGGSQRLDPEAAYAPKFSERWMISINV